MSQQGVLLVNLGSPDSTDIPDVRKYLNEFLMDGRVIDYPWLLRRFVVNMVLRKRPPPRPRPTAVFGRRRFSSGGDQPKGHTKTQGNDGFTD